MNSFIEQFFFNKIQECLLIGKLFYEIDKHKGK